MLHSMRLDELATAGEGRHLLQHDQRLERGSEMPWTEGMSSHVSATSEDGLRRVEGRLDEVPEIRRQNAQM